MKTYSRARSAKAAALKILDMHEVPADGYNLLITEESPNRFSATVQFRDTPEEGLQDDLRNGGIGMFLLDPVPAKEPAILELNPGPEMPVPAPAPATIEELEERALAVEPKIKTPKGEGSVARVWQICDANPGMSRKLVIAACVEAGINYGTARTQYQRWFTAKKQK